METDPPKTIGRYQVERLLGAGAMGFVYLATDPELDRLVAIKTLRDLTLDETALQVFLERFRNEARAAARLHHPAIVQVYDVGDDPEVGPFLVFEYVPGSTLRQLIRTRGNLSPDDVVLLAEEIGEALDEAHGNNVIHRDIKPDNLLVTEFGKGKLADFGVARIPNAALTKEGQFLGTPCYAAPETLRDGEYGPETDLFSFAAVLYEAASGKRAFPGDEALAVAHKVVHDEPLAPSAAAPFADIPPSVDEVLLRGLSKTPGVRHRSAGDLAYALREAYGDAGLLSDHSSGRLSAMSSRDDPTQRVRTGGRGTGHGRGWLMFLVFACLGAAGVALVIQLAGPTQSQPQTAVTDAGADAGDTLSRQLDASGVALVREDAASPLVVQSGNPQDAAAADAVDAGTDAGSDAGFDAAQDTTSGPPPRRESPEEVAKDAIVRARSLIRAGRLREARRALDVAKRNDPGLDDIEELEALIAGQP